MKYGDKVKDLIEELEEGTDESTAGTDNRVPLVAQPVGVAVVPGVVVLLPEAGDDVLDLLLRFHGVGQRDEAGAVVLEQALAPGRDAPVCVVIFHRDESSVFYEILQSGRIFIVSLISETKT